MSVATRRKKKLLRQAAVETLSVSPSPTPRERAWNWIWKNGEERKSSQNDALLIFPLVPPSTPKGTSTYPMWER